eukprot:TRINITY_DN2596_c0_g1_i1.p2 TRINITY_DN2596_c0_g1~~TRINITY_DN2596_c0_g1_i1.p2  ORF type:complete len:188 (+),score=15.04 TRINITY_DN2596_c0_g1_i1:546-1109(+)
MSESDSGSSYNKLFTDDDTISTFSDKVVDEQVTRDDEVSELPRKKWRGPEGPKVGLTGKNESEIFFQFITKALLADILDLSIAHATSQGKNIDISLSNLLAFLGLLFLMDVVRKDDIRDYWSTTACVSTPFFGDVMSKNKFMTIVRGLFFGEKQGDSLGRVRLLLRNILCSSKVVGLLLSNKTSLSG